MWLYTQPMILAVGSNRQPKLEAVHRVVARLARFAPALSSADVVARDVGGVAPRMPLSLQQLLDGARNRAVRVLELLAGEGRKADIAIGLEGGLEIADAPEGRRAFLTCWAYATDGRRGSFGCGGAIELPAVLAEAVINRGEELGDAVDAYSGSMNVRSGAGAWGLLTRGAMDRSAAFEIALVNALAPFYNGDAYQPPPRADEQPRVHADRGGPSSGER